ncbi:MAG TPA: DUF6766 family protein [Actinomycetota bacterium]|nr:DUF6766 family protein [Actinomycetota bacterium]
MSTLTLVAGLVMMAAITVYLVYVLVRTIRSEARKRNIRKIWANFGLSLVLMILFFGSWIGHAFAQWSDYVAEQEQHQEPAVVSEYLAEFSKATLENWQSEFLQLFSFVVLAAIFLHRGSAESRDSDDEIQASLQRIEAALNTKES